MSYQPGRARNEQPALETRVVTPAGTFTTGRVALFAGALCRVCGARKVHQARAGHLFCFGCGVNQ